MWTQFGHLDFTHSGNIHHSSKIMKTHSLAGSPSLPKHQKSVHVIAHTHWDRAWYWPFERFRLKLVECVKAVLRDLRADPDYRFQFDGQVLMLEDYLAICPGDAAYLRDCARQGRIKIGPMYCLSDVYCTGGEALIRNLLIGRECCEAFGGGRSEVLHMPDTFGITPCLPMVAEGFGFKAFSFMRGVAGQVPGLVDMQNIQGIEPQIPSDTRWFHWIGPDGSRITAIRLREGYASAALRMGLDPGRGEVTLPRYAEALRTAAAKWDTPAHPVVLLMAGVDHQIPWEKQGEAQHLASAEGGYAFHFSTLDAMADALAETDPSDWPECRHQEFHGSGAGSVLGGTVSTRIHLKQTNAAIEQLLVHQVEPAIAFARLLGRDDPAFAALTHAWKTLLATHPHDDICGCSVDAVHRRNESDMEQAFHCADALRRRAYQRLADVFGGADPADPRPQFVLVNFQPRTRRHASRVRLDFEGQRSWGDIALPPHFRIVDEAGREVPFVEIRRGQSTEHPRLFVELELFAELPSMVWKRFFVEAMEAPVHTSSLVLENPQLRITPREDGSFDLLDKSTGILHARQGFFTSQSDIGDSYDFSDIPGEAERELTPLGLEIQIVQHSGGASELKLSGSFELPASVDSATRTPSPEAVRIPFEQRLLLAPDAAELDVCLSFTNHAADHRLRWNVALPSHPASSLAGLAFHTVRRPAGEQPTGDTAPRIFPEHPMDSLVAAESVAVFSDFPRNYEIVRDSAGSRIAITVLRSVSWLCNPHQGATRPGIHAGPHTFVPEARFLGRSCRQRLCLRPYAPAEEERLYGESLLWRAQPFSGQPDATCVQAPVTVPMSFPTVCVRGDVLLSACKPASDGDGMLLRLQNPHPGPQTFAMTPPPGCTVEEVRLDETPWNKAPSTSLPPLGTRSFRIRGKAAGIETTASPKTSTRAPRNTTNGPATPKADPPSPESCLPRSADAHRAT